MGKETPTTEAPWFQREQLSGEIKFLNLVKDFFLSDTLGNVEHLSKPVAGTQPQPQQPQQQQGPVFVFLSNLNVGVRMIREFSLPKKKVFILSAFQFILALMAITIQVGPEKLLKLLNQ